MDLRHKFSGSVEVVCRLFSRFEGLAKCRVQYWIVPWTERQTSYADTSDIAGRAGDVLPITLSARFEPNAILVMQASTEGGKQEVSVEGIRLETGRYHILYNMYQSKEICLSFYVHFTFPDL